MADDLREFALEQDNILEPFGQLDLMLYYGVIFPANEPFLNDHEVATKILIPNGPTLLKRGSDLSPLTADDVAAADTDFIELRAEIDHLDDAREELTETEELLWQYIFPRKYMAAFYATNYEDSDTIERVFYDIDRGENVSAEEALNVTRAFVRFLKEDEAVQDITAEIFTSWTGNSFHVYLLLEEGQPPDFYDEQLKASRTEELDTITERAVAAVNEDVDVEVIGGHEKEKGKVAIDPSQTPPGKLDRIPLGSLHLKDAITVDGVSLPLTRDELFEEDVLGTLLSYTPRAVLENIEELKEKLPDVSS